MSFLRKCFVILFVILSVTSVFAQPVEEKINNEISYVTVTDQIGRSVEIVENPQKIVSGYYISSSACIAMGLKDNLVAIEAQADKRPIYKLAAEELIEIPNVGTAKSFNLEACISMEPDLVILPKKQQETANILMELGIPSIVVNPESHEEIIEMFELIGKATSHEKEAQILIGKYNEILDFVSDRVKNITDKPVVYICGTENYLTTASKDMYQGKIIEQAGGINAGSEIEGSTWKKISYEQLIKFNPDIIVIPTNSNANGHPDYSVDDILSDLQLSEIKAVKNKAIYQMPIGFEAWDSPVPSGALGTLWMLNTIHSELCSNDELENRVNNFYKELYGFDARYCRN